MGIHLPHEGSLVWVFFFSPLLMPWCPSCPQTVLGVHLIPDCYSALHTLSDGASSPAFSCGVYSASLWITLWLIDLDVDDI